MAEILISVVAKVAEYLVAPIVRPLGYLFNYRSNHDKLQEQLEKLGVARGRLQQDVAEANRQGEEIEPDVQQWLTRTEGIIQKAEKLIEDGTASNKSCFNLKSRYQGSRQAKKQAGDVAKLQEDCKFDRVSYRLPPQGIWSARIRGYEAFGSRVSTLNQIMEALRNDDITMIGVWGMGGVGKTTLANQVAKQAEEDKLFEKVVMASNISQVPNVTKIQGEIASMLGLEFKEGVHELGRADCLCKGLKKHKTVLVILDDIWEEFSLENIGIPYGDVHEGCKVLLTSREQDVLSKGMGTQKNFHVQHLCEQEAWSLFKKTAGDSVEKLELRPIACEVVKECEGLPIALVTIAKALEGESVAIWKNALEELKRSEPTNIKGVSKNVYSCLELSYNHLEGDEVRRLFLLCGMLSYGNISMNQLLKYGMGLDLFEHMSSLEEITNKLVTLVKILKDSSLLLDVEDGYGYEWPGMFSGYNDENKFVRMHDVVGDVARAIAAKDPHRFVVIKEALGLVEWQRKEEFRNCSRLSLKCSDLHELPERLVCPKLEFFLLNGDNRSLRIPNTFFVETKLLKVLDLSEMNLTPLPSSLGFLSNLRTLCVYGCTLQDIAVIGELKKLQVLSFASSKIELLPNEMTQLTDLRVLDLWDCSLEVIPRNVISSLSRLEHLCLAESFTKWGAEGLGSRESNNACLSELNNLSYLRTLYIEIRDPNLLSEDLVFENFTRYMISVSPKEPVVHEYNRSPRMLKLCGVNKPRLVDCFSKLLNTVEDLELLELKDTKHVLYELDTQSFLQLKRLRIMDSPGIQYIVNSTKGVPSHSAFPILEELRLSKLHEMAAVCYGPIPEGSFGNLTSLIVVGCERMKSFILLPMEQGMDGSVFPQMGSLDLTRNLSTGTTATQESSTSDVLRPFFNQQVTFPHLEFLRIFNLDVIAMWHNQLPLESFYKLKNLEIEFCNKLWNVFPSNILKGLQSLEFVIINCCYSTEEIFDLEEVNCEEIHDIATIPLRELSLYGLKSLKSVWNKDPQELVSFQNLRSLHVTKCPCLKCLFPVTIAKSLVQLQVLLIEECGVEEIVANENGEEAMPSLFPKLTSLALYDLGKLKCFNQGTCTPRWPLLKNLVVWNCDQVETLFQEVDLKGYTDGPIQQPFFLLEKDAFPRLIHVSLKGLPLLTHLSGSTPILENLCSLEVSDCRNLIYLVTPSMARTLVQLRKLTIEKCKPMKEIVKNEEGEEPYDIGFSKLQRLTLVELQSLKCFGPARYTFTFPSLEQLVVKRCPQMESFCEGVLSTPSLQGVKIDDHVEEHLGCDLNTIIRTIFSQKDSEGNHSEDSEDEDFDDQDSLDFDEGGYWGI